MKRETLVLSPIFSTTNQHGGTFPCFTPKNYILTPRIENQQSSTCENSAVKSTFEMENAINSKMDGLVGQLKMEIKKNQIFTENCGLKKDSEDRLSLDIELINDTYLTDRLSKPSTVRIPQCKPATHSSCRRFGEWTLSPNSSFLPRKKT